MFPVEQAARYVRETAMTAARLQEHTTPERYAALVRRAERLLDGMFQVDVQLEPELMVKIALREKFVAERVERAILMVATWQLIGRLAAKWSARRTPRRVAARALETVGV